MSTTEESPTTEEPSDHPGAQHANVTEALAAVMAELPGIGKDGKADPAQGGYRYRGIEQITAHAQTLLAKHGVVPYPRVKGDPKIVPITVNSKPWTDTILKVEYRFKHGPSDTEELAGPFIGIGRDNSDKGANKCMTQTFKYALIQVLCIGDKADDADGQSHEADAPQEWWEWAGYKDEDHQRSVTAELLELFNTVPKANREPIKKWIKDHADDGYTTWLPVKLEHVDEYTKLLAAARDHDSAAAPAQEPQELPPPQAAPDSAPKAAKGADAASASAGPQPAAEPDDEVKEITETIRGMDPTELDAALVRRGKTPGGTVPSRQKMLAALMVQEAAEKRQRGSEEF
jgi:hypothetical protein